MTTQNAKIKFLIAYFAEGGRLEKSPDMFHLLLSLPGVYSFQERLKVGFILLSAIAKHYKNVHGTIPQDLLETFRSA